MRAQVRQTILKKYSNNYDEYDQNNKNNNSSTAAAATKILMITISINFGENRKKFPVSKYLLFNSVHQSCLALLQFASCC